MSRASLLMLLLLGAVTSTMLGLRGALSPGVLVIQAGPRGGSFDLHARRYAELLASHGLRAEVRNQDDTLKIIERVNDPAAGVQVGFTAQRLDAQRYPAVDSAGVVELQPLFLFLRRGAAEPATLAGLAGRRLVLPMEGSATAQATLDILALYQVTRDNTRFTFTTIGDAAAALQRGEQDAGFFILAPDNPLIRRLATDPGLALHSFDDNLGITRRFDHLKPATLVRGAFDLRASQPPHDVALVGATVNVVVRKDIHPAALYALLQAMNEVHKGQTLVSDAGEYPSQAGTVLPVHPLALEWARSGTPWHYGHLPAAAAAAIDAYWEPVLVLLAVASGFGTLRSLNEFMRLIEFRIALQLLAWLQRRVDRGQGPGVLARTLFRLAEPAVLKQDNAALARLRLEKLRPHMQALSA